MLTFLKYQNVAWPLPYIFHAFFDGLCKDANRKVESLGCLCDPVLRYGRRLESFRRIQLRNTIHFFFLNAGSYSLTGTTVVQIAQPRPLIVTNGNVGFTGFLQGRLVGSVHLPVQRKQLMIAADGFLDIAAGLPAIQVEGAGSVSAE